jgi:beta-galactosidase
MAGDLMRSLGAGRPWILMEQSPNRVNWRVRNAAKASGQMRLWSYQAIARGADGVLFFQWRQSRAGAEKWHSAMVPHGPRDSSPTWHEVVRLGDELARLDAVRDARVPAEVAIVLDWESWWALELPSKPSADVRLLERVEACYEALYRASVTADFVPPEGDLSRYRVVVVPNLYLVTDAGAENLRRHVAGGGTLVVSFFSGMVDPSDHVRLGGYPGAFRDLLGLRVEDFEPLDAGQRVGLRFAEGGGGTAHTWSERITPLGAEVIAAFEGGGPAVLRHRYGLGVAWYLGTAPEPEAMARILRRAWTEAGVDAAAAVPEGVEAVRRGDLLFLLNHGVEEAEVSVPSGRMELIAGLALETDRLRLGPRDVAVVMDPAPPRAARTA